MNPAPLTTQCCIAGGGPAGVMLGFLLARAGVDVIVLEKWKDFFRDFRGDTIHPATLQIFSELGLLDAFLQLPHQKTYRLGGSIGGQDVIMADFSRLRVRCPFIAFIPQWDFLNFVVREASRYPAFHLRTQAAVTDLIEADGRIAGVIAQTPEGPLEIRAELVIGADGRHSTVRQKAGLVVDDLGAPMDVLWFRISRQAGDPEQTLGRIDGGKIMIMIARADYWQCGFVIRKGGFEELRGEGLTAFQERVGQGAPFLANRQGEIASWDAVKLLTVRVDRLRRWHRPGLLCLGDSAHAMSPIGGVGINLAIQDAVAAANRLAPRFLAGGVRECDLAAIQRRRMWPTRVVQRMQVFIQNRVISRVLATARSPRLAWPIRLSQRFPRLQTIPAYFVGVGVRPEHVRTRDVLPRQTR